MPGRISRTQSQYMSTLPWKGWYLLSFVESLPTSAVEDVDTQLA